MSKKRTERGREKDRGHAEEDHSKVAAGPHDSTTTLTIDDYHCTGNLEADFPGLCALLGMKEIPAVIAKNPATESTIGVTRAKMESAAVRCKPCLQVEVDNGDPFCVKSIKASGWKMEEKVVRALCKALPSLSHLQKLHLWQTGLTEQMVISFKNSTCLCSHLRTVVFEGNCLPGQIFHLLMSEPSSLAHLSLRNNRIGDEGACLIGAALSTPATSNRHLVSLNLAFNSICDVGAAHIAKGLRLNRALLYLSLSNNRIGDKGAACLAEFLGPFALTHEEIVERRKALLERDHPETHKKLEKAPVVSPPGAVPKRDDHKVQKKPADGKGHRGKAGKSGGKDKHSPVSDQEDETCGSANELGDWRALESPFLEPLVQHRNGQVVLPGNSSLMYLNLSGNRISEQSLPLFLSSLRTQSEGGGLRRLYLQRNRFPLDCKHYVELQELMAPRDLLHDTTAVHMEEEQGA